MKKKIIVTVTMIAVLAGSVFAQGLPGDGFLSPQNTATNGRIRSYADDFMRPDSFHNVNFDNWFGFASFQSTLRAALGYATRLGKATEDEEGKAGKKPVFLGLFYGGSAWANFQSPDRRLENDVTYIEGANLPTLTTGANNLPYNQIAVLLGLPKMGFRLSFYSTYKGISQKDFTFTDTDNNTNTEYKFYKTGYGRNSFQLGWSMSNNLTNIGIRPWVTFDLDFDSNFTKNETSAGDSTVGNSENYIQPILQFGLGGITVANKKGWRTSVDLEYRARIQIHGSEFSYTPIGGGNTQIGKISGRNRPDNPNTLANERIFDEYFWMDHRIRPSVSTQWNGEKFRFRSKFDLNVVLVSSDSTAQTDNNGILTSGDNTNVFTFTLNPDLYLAAQWQFAQKFFLNMGGRININALNFITTKANNGKTSRTTFGEVGNNLTLGFTINATDNLFIEANAGIGTDNVVSTFTTTTSATTGRLEGLLMFGGILLGLKY